jgi:FXSXX-COOH protein
MTYDDSPYRGETFCSDVADLSRIDLATVSSLPDSVLRSAISRVLRELAGNSGASASFQSSLPRLQPDGEAAET